LSSYCRTKKGKIWLKLKNMSQASERLTGKNLLSESGNSLSESGFRPTTMSDDRLWTAQNLGKTSPRMNEWLNEQMTVCASAKLPQTRSSLGTKQHLKNA
jgi:hypothetical protein